ncbi:MAG TPA: BON domain-containing protein [Steroidobacteraceae bacterium]|nr:BON domain-containing protein [Steroidobacteraceae bacterium]
MNTITKSVAGLTGVALTVAVTYLLDPDNGRQRRSTLGAQCKNAGTRINERARSLKEGVSHRYQDVTARARSWFDARKRTDQGLARTIRVSLRRAVPQANGIGVVAHGDQIILHGDVLAQEHQHVLEVARAVPGVGSVMDHLTDVPEVSAPKIGPRLRQGFSSVRDNLAQPHWSPTARVSTGAVGLALVRFGATHRNLVGGIGALAGAALIARSVFNTPLRQIARRKAKAAEAPEMPEAASPRTTRAAERFTGTERFERVM